MNEQKMKILVFGSGVIGTTYAWQLQEAGFDVTLFVRKLRMVRYSHSGVGITYTDMRGAKTEAGHTVFRPKVIDKLDEKNPFDLIIACVRSNQLGDAIPYIARFSGNAAILFLGSMWDEQGLAAKHFPGGRYFFGYPGAVGGGHIENGVNCFLFNKGQTLLGEPGGKETPRLQATKRMLDAAGLRPALHPRIGSLLCNQYLVSAILPPLINKAGSARVSMASRKLTRQYVSTLKEGLKVCRKKGADRAATFPFNRFFLPPFILVPLIQKHYNTEMQDALDAWMKYGADEKKKQYYDVLKSGQRMKISMPYWRSFEKYLDFS